MTLLTPHFTLEELIHSDTANQKGISNVPDQTVRDRLAQLAGKLEDVRALLGGHPIQVTSGYRSAELNQAIGGAATSAHLFGCAADFTCEGFGDPYKICSFLTGVEGFIYDQLINEEGSGQRWVHLGLAVTAEPSRGMDLTIASGTVKTGFYPV